MTPTASWRYLGAAAAVTGMLAAPQLGAASGGSGGAGLSPTQSASGTVSASANGMTITTRASGFLRRKMMFIGSAKRRDAGRVVEIERAGRQTGGKWALTTRATVQPNGSFSAHWRVNRAGPFAIRAILAGSGTGHTASSWPTVNVIVYRVSLATIFGPGLWGRGTACGETLRHKTLGVANRTLPCGTQVSIYYRGRTIVVPVIDRGPYANGANWDLTEATARALRMDGTAKIGAVPVPQK